MTNESFERIVKLPIDPSTNQNVQFGDSPSVDAFSRLRVSNGYSLFDVKQLHDKSPLIYDDAEVSGSGTSSIHSDNTASVTMAVSNATAGKRVRQTFRRFNYQPGKSQLIMVTFVLDKSGGGTGIKRKIGYFDDENGIYLFDDEGTIKIVTRSKSSGSVIDNEVSQSNWGLDKLDGSGPSGITLDLKKVQIFVIDFQWLVVGRIRVGFNINGIIYYCHEFSNANISDTSYMSTPNLPLRDSIENTGAGVASELKTIFHSIISEGGQDELGQTRYFSTAGSRLRTNATGTTYAVCGIRLKSTHLDSEIQLVHINMINRTNDDFEWLLILNPTVATPITFSDEINSFVQTGIGNTDNPSSSTVTGGTKLSGGFVKSSNSAGSRTEELKSVISLGAAIDGTRDEIYLCVKPLSDEPNIQGSLEWRELF